MSCETSTLVVVRKSFTDYGLKSHGCTVGSLKKRLTSINTSVMILQSVSFQIIMIAT